MSLFSYLRWHCCESGHPLVGLEMPISLSPVRKGMTIIASALAWAQSAKCPEMGRDCTEADTLFLIHKKMNRLQAFEVLFCGSGILQTCGRLSLGSVSFTLHFIHSFDFSFCHNPSVLSSLWWTQLYAPPVSHFPFMKNRKKGGKNNLCIALCLNYLYYIKIRKCEQAEN